jgi:hypothetical protein
MKQRARRNIILFRGAIGSVKTCHKKAYDHAAESARTSGVACPWWSHRRCLAAAANPA